MNNYIAPPVREYITVLHDKSHSGCHGILWIVRVLLILIILLLPSVAAAEGVNDFTFSHLGLADGLNSQRIYSLKQTDDGAVWLNYREFCGPI